MGGSSGGGGGSTTTVQKSDPWAGQQSYLTYGFDQAKNQYNSQNPQYYPGQTVAPLSDTTNLAMNLQTQRALNGNPLTNAAQGQLGNTVAGNYLNSNPYLDANFQAGTDAISKAYGDTVRGNTASFEGGGRTGSGMQAFYNNQANDTLAKNLNNLYGQTYYTNYTNERQNQLNATQLAPTYAGLDYTNLDALSNVGAAQDANNQNILNSNIDRWNYNQNLNANKLGQYMNMIQGNYGGTSSSSGTYTPKSSSSNLFGGALSGAATGASIGSVIPGIGTGLGAVFGGLGGLFSDKRLKTKIKEIGKNKDGLTIYSFEYIGSSEPQIGFMADEVEKIIPEAVTIHASGYKMVNYDIARV